MREELSKYLKITEALLKLDIEEEAAELPRLGLLLDARETLIEDIKKLKLSTEEKMEFIKALNPLDEALGVKLKGAMGEVEAGIEELKKIKSSKARTRTALVNYEGRNEDSSSVFFDKNT